MKIKFETFSHHFIIKKRPFNLFKGTSTVQQIEFSSFFRFENSFSLIVESVIHTFVWSLRQIKKRSGVGFFIQLECLIEFLIFVWAEYILQCTCFSLNTTYIL